MDAEGVGRRREFADGPQMHPGTRAIDVEPADGQENEADIHQDALVGEEDRSQNGDAGQDGYGEARQQRERPGLAQALAKHQAQADGGEIERQAADHLIGLELDGDDGMDLAEQAAGQHGHDHAQPWIAGDQRHGDARHGANQHHALDAQVEHPRPLGEDLPDRGEEQHGASGDPGLQNDDRVHGQPSCLRTTIRTRYRIRKSLAIRQTSTMPWIILGTPDGWISRPARISAPNRIDTGTTASGLSLASQAMMIPVKP